MARFLRAAIFIAFIFSAKGAFAACHVVTPSGSGSKTGADWNNAYAGLPSTLTRGDIYYLADGSYGGYSFSTPDSGTTIVEIRKAQTPDHCTDTGWNAATMGSSQALIPGITVVTDYVKFNGNGTSTAAGCGGAPGATVTSAPPTPSDCGIKTNGGYLGNLNTGLGGTHAEFDYIEEEGTGINVSDTIEFEGSFNPGAGAYATFTHSYLHNAGCVYMEYGGDHRIEHDNYFWGTEIDGAPSSSPCHGQAEFYGMNDSNGQIYRNVYRDIRGTAVFTFATPAGTHTGWAFWDNVFFNSNPTASWTPAVTNAIIACINDGIVCDNFLFYGNTINHLGYSSGSLGAGQVGLDLSSGASGSGWIAENNLFYDNPVGVNWLVDQGAAITVSHNSCLNSTNSACFIGGTGHGSDVVSTSSSNPFTNISAGNFTLSSDNANWNNRASLGSPYDTDAAGNAFTTDRGAYQYSGSVAQAPQPPTDLIATVQ
jgi:hypothetical protein